MPAVNRHVRVHSPLMGKECMQEEQDREASQQITSEGPADMRVEGRASEGVMPEGAAGPIEMAIDTQVPAPSGMVPAQYTTALPLSSHVEASKAAKHRGMRDVRMVGMGAACLVVHAACMLWQWKPETELDQLHS